MKEVVWVIGASASGKETFIRYTLTSEDLARRLGWSGKTVVACEASLTYIGQFDDDPIVEQRERIFSEVKTVLQDADVVLIKWQYADIAASRPESLKKLLPDVRHRVVELHAPLPELVERLKNKPWWNDIGNEEGFIKRSLKTTSDITANLKDNFEITRIDSGAHGGFRITE